MNQLGGRTPIGDEEPLKNVKKALGSLSQVVGNPLFKAEITLQVTVQFFDFNTGLFIAPAALPVACQSSIPLYIFGLTDWHGGYLASHLIAPPLQPWTLGPFGIVGFNVVPLAGSAAVNGDMYLQYGIPLALLPPLGGAAMITIHCNNVSYGTFLNCFVSDLIVVNNLRIIVPVASINQLINPVIFGYQSLFGKLATDTIDPRMYKTPADFQNQICDIPVTFPVDKNLMISQQVDVFCPTISYVFMVQKVEPLTLKPKL